MIETILFLILSVCGSTGGELAIARGVQTVGEPHSFRPRAIIGFLGRVFSTKSFLVGLSLMATAFFSLLVLLSWHPVSFVLPATALNYVAGTLGARFLLREQVSRARWTGVFLVCIGVGIVVSG